jgi:uncharacterized membrane protein YeiH
MTCMSHGSQALQDCWLPHAAGNAGGISRDLLIGSVPPAGIADWRYVAVSLLAGVSTFWCPSVIQRLNNPVLLFDAAGLGLFAVAGTQKALAFGLKPVAAALLGMLTGIGGGMTRDVLLAEIPTVLRADLYALAALAGAAVVVIGAILHLQTAAVMAAGALLCFGLRFMAIRRRWRLPILVTRREGQRLSAGRMSVRVNDVGCDSRGGHTAARAHL